MNINLIAEQTIDDFVSTATTVKAERIYKNCEIALLKIEDNVYYFLCQSESDKYLNYEVEIDFTDVDDPAPVCECKQYEKEDFCKHVAACLFFLQNGEANGYSTINKQSKKNVDIANTYTKTSFIENSNTSFTQKYNSNNLNEWSIFYGLNAAKRYKVHDLSGNDFVSILFESQQKSLAANVLDGKKTFLVEIKKTHDKITAQCACGKLLHPCEHTLAVFYNILNNKKNNYYLDTLIDTTLQKNVLLSKYGLIATDPEAEMFDFYFANTDLKIRPKNNSITELANWNTGGYIKRVIEEKKIKPAFKPFANNNYICILSFYVGAPNVRWQPYTIEGNVDNIKAIDKLVRTGVKEEIYSTCKKDADFIYLHTPNGMCNKLNEEGIIKYFYNAESEIKSLSPTNLYEVKRIIIEAYKNNINHLAEADYFFISTSKSHKHKVADLVRLSFSKNYFKVHLKVIEQSKFIQIKPFIKIEEELFPIIDFDNNGDFLLIKNNIAYLPQSEPTWRILAEFKQKSELLFPQTEANKLIKEYLWPLRNDIGLELPTASAPQLIDAANISFAVRLKEMEPHFLLFEPIIKYNGKEVLLDGEDVELFDNNELIVVNREEEKETFLKQAIENLHPNFAEQTDEIYYYLTFKEALEKGWFFDAIKKLKENNIEIYGQKSLTKFKYNGHKPKLDIKGGSGIDWFELKIEITYGDQLVPLKALKQAILNKNDFIQLGDGTLGILPEDWVKKFRPLFQLGNVKNEDELQVSKFHYTLIDELYDNISEDDILNELAFKKEQLNQIESVQTITKSKNISAKLRPYQLAGLNWLNQMHAIGWGGCLADDMGLGKTLQTLCFLQKLHDEKKSVKVLIVCPTSLIYNWQAEIDKFTKGMKYVIYHGGEREFPKAKSSKWNLLITSYGTLRNDIELFSTINFEVAILDESQAIKNPVSLITKAVRLINTKYRFVLSGTPVQNNTFDLYAQLNFCNPGLLGNQEFFKTEFATAIDKYGDREKSEQLRKMVFPFILRRTKEQVAKDLPDKTETVMYCEMGNYQQKVYDTVKEDYKLRILGKIDEVGVAKAAFLILEGLNKLRQICDCPSLIGDVEKNRFKQSSIKLDELMREIEENISNHKMLIFSQFLGMLALVKEKLDADGIKYVYLDGSTPAKDRKLLVDKFQTDTTIQVFLISLKAGGVGLNLTAADYVYVIDPWWNPAVEDQAIDRTHRIGQTKKVFAYKMICKNTIEEKIMQLQAKKKSLAKELISEDASFVKKLTKDDVAWLLS